MIRRVGVAILVTAFVGIGGALLLSRRQAIAPIDPPSQSSFSAESIARGEALATAGHCASCHTRAGGQPFAGGYGVNTPFGIVYGTNITPDSKTGIGTWPLDAFLRAMREGVARDGSHLFPAFPYNAYTELTYDDLRALYAYLMTRQPVSAGVPSNTVPFPLNVRALQEGWKLLFFRSGRFQSNPAKSGEWNRGAYLAEALCDCGGCHTPRNSLGAEKTSGVYAGTVVDGWIAPALDRANPSPLPWTQEDLFTFLRTGTSSLHGAAGGTMIPVIRDALALAVVPDSDVRAIAVYFSDVNQPAVRASSVDATVREAIATSDLAVDQPYDADATLYASACMSCHYNGRPAPVPARPELALNSALTLPEPTNFIQVVLNGVSSINGAPGLVMPAYASLTDIEIARLAAYLRRTRTKRPPWNDMEKKVAAVRRESAGR
ncbi:MAG TPA: cytochrome c [Bryobacteraceae bacterium]|nr:cytochrome c [Bryobacteraceae bacterium]